jgi:ubiquinone/menaquinone biosynthesis C-methylase UbiE
MKTETINMEFIQKKVFIEEEANQWFSRNIEKIKNYNGFNDTVYHIIKRYNINPKSIMEVGCSAGYRLAFLKEQFTGCEIYGIDPSTQAIEYGQTVLKLSGKEIESATADNLSHIPDNSFDCVIVGFVFYVVDRSLLLKVVAEIDRVLKNKGDLILIDFFSTVPRRNHYHHIKSVQMYSYKQEYEKLFLSTQSYHLLAKDTLNHSTNNYCSTDNFYDKYSFYLLKKDLEAVYQ